ncbi:hypothetical protein L7F22_058073 [Adiantum nelumboides]|nr:hypothetical protein [Adiantum nelumboides]
MDVLVNKGLATPLKDHKEGAYNDDQWEELDARARATIWLHLGESIFFTIMDKTTAFEIWDSLCLAWDDKSASNKVFLKLMRLSMKESSSVNSYLNEFNALYLQLTSKGLNFDDEIKAIFLLCSLPASWDTFNTAISISTHGGKLVFGDVISALLTEEIRHQSLDSGGHGDVYMIENAQDDNDLVKLDDMGAIMVHEKEKEEEKSAYEDVEVYIPEIPWENNNDQNDAYEEYQKFIRDESFGVSLKVKDSYVIPHDDDHNYVKNKEMKDDTSSELCDVNIDLSSNKSARKRKATSKLLELLKKKEKVLRVSKNKNKKTIHMPMVQNGKDIVDECKSLSTRMGSEDDENEIEKDEATYDSDTSGACESLCSDQHIMDACNEHEMVGNGHGVSTSSEDDVGEDDAMMGDFTLGPCALPKLGVGKPSSGCDTKVLGHEGDRDKIYVCKDLMLMPSQRDVFNDTCPMVA